MSGQLAEDNWLLPSDRRYLAELWERTRIGCRRPYIVHERERSLIPGTYDPEPLGGSVCATGFCRRCGRTLISAVEVRSEYSFSGTCGRCATWSSSERVEHQEWLRRRRSEAQEGTG